MDKYTTQVFLLLIHRHKSVHFHGQQLPLHQIFINETEASKQYRAKSARKTVSATQGYRSRRQGIYVNYWAATS